MALEVRDVEYVTAGVATLVLGLSLTRAPDELEVALIESWPTPAEIRQNLRVEGTLLVAEVPDDAGATVTIDWLMGEHGLAAIDARAEERREQGDRLLDALRERVHTRYDAGPADVAPAADVEPAPVERPLPGPAARPFE